MVRLLSRLHKIKNNNTVIGNKKKLLTNEEIIQNDKIKSLLISNISEITHVFSI